MLHTVIVNTFYEKHELILGHLCTEVRFNEEQCLFSIVPHVIESEWRI